MEATFPYSGNAFFNKSFIRLVETEFLPSGNSFFFIRAIFLLVEAITGIRVKAVFLSSSGNNVSQKAFILATGNGF